ncbi:uncharacterized protein LOC117335884 [Pecten maximus]|uniref:uncharacterized protein LOC117335884 n=1 Tax=Pecten maximus TaxID=6579 RepID=UPI0014584744|nr:uncharacterized protein LOC117335884 [Pecten maximus]
MGTTAYLLVWLSTLAFTAIGKVGCLVPPVYLVTSPDGNVTVEEGQPIKLSCEVHNSDGTAQLQWDLPPNFKLRASAITWEDKQSNVNKLTIDEAMIGDSGKFDCRVENIVKSVYVTVKASEIHDILLDSTNIHDRVHVEMAIVPPRRKIQIMEGESVRVNCSVNLSRPYPHVMKNAQLSWITKKNKVHQKRVDNSTITLIIDNANSSDAGFYTCWFNTSQGSTQKLFYISVNAKFRLQGDIARLQGDIARLPADIARLQDDIARLQGDIARLQDDKARLQDDIARLQDDIARLQGDIARLQGDIARLQDDIARLHDDIARLQDDIARLQGDIARLQGDIARLQGDIARLQGDIARLQGDIARLLGDIARLQGDIARLLGDIARLQGDIAR